MSNMGSAGHNQWAPGFGQAYDAFADLRGDHDNIDEALNFEDTYDGLGDQLDETDDAFNDDTFGDTGTDAVAAVGKDFDFYGATAKVADAMEEEHQRFSLHQQVSRTMRAPVAQTYDTGYAYQPNPPVPKPARTGYEKYKEEPTELQIDASIWGVAPKKAATPAAMPQPPPPATGRKVMSLEEVEAAMRAEAKQTPPVPAASLPQSLPQYHTREFQAAAEPSIYPRAEQLDPIRQPIDGRQQRGFQTGDYQQAGAQGSPHGHPITILQRPARHTPSSVPAMPSPVPQHQQQAPPIAPTHILQNPNRAPIEGTRVGIHMHPAHKSQNSIPRGLPQQHQLSDLSEREKAAFVEAEARRAKRNHKIHLMSGNNGLMTPQDKSFITRIQLQQLVSATGDPSEQGNEAALAEDFYYQVLSSLRAGQRPNPNQPLNNFAQTYLFQTGTRRGGPRHHGPQNHVQRMEQQVQRAVEAAKNKPKNKQLVIEGSLGKISFSNAKTPKPLLNIKRTDNGVESNRPSSSQRTQPTSKGHDKKDALRDIESVYQTLMKMEDLTRSIPPPGGPKDPEVADKQDEFNKLNEQLWNHLRVHEPISTTIVHPFISFMSYPKGKRAIPRVFRYLSPTQRTTILTMIIIHLDQLDVIRGAQVQTGEPISLDAATRERIELFSLAVMPSLFQLLNESDLDIVTGVLGLITHNLNVDLIARTRIGVSMLTMILSRAELIKQAGQANEESWQQWVATFNIFFNTLEPSLHNIFPGTVTSGEDIYVWQFLAAIGIGASPDEQQRLVFAVKDRVMGTVGLAKTLPPDMAKERLDNVNLFMRSIGLDVELLN
ncbi:putative topoisomerase II-associated protein PAT1 [Rosellinia necatrix]|uniref:Putative topoisomerase II-associated protein PAT1 n=1 Tax=Rosellinia necatrix TaxID=77044 RepID=A0A1W2TH09_ROSNE|nr:putative topoisomerase II-associated protein PAT1 [Rosellinia necatrix]